MADLRNGVFEGKNLWRHRGQAVRAEVDGERKERPEVADFRGGHELREPPDRLLAVQEVARRRAEGIHVLMALAAVPETDPSIPRSVVTETSVEPPQESCCRT